MARLELLLGCALFLLSSICAFSDVVEHTFLVHNMTVRRMCKDVEITVVNRSLPGPTLYVREGDSVTIHVVNESPYNITIHWHGVFQLFNCWQDGPEYITQCPILPGNNYTYRFNITGQEGTLLWHAHSGFHRATVHGALVIRPRADRSYPFPKPHDEFPIVIGEWYNQSIIHLENQLKVTGNGPNYSQGYTFNGWLGDFYPCSSTRRRFLNDEQNEKEYSTLKLNSENAGSSPDIYEVKVTRGKTYLIRLVNAALNAHIFFKIANHNMTVVAVDAFYTNPFPTDFVVISPGQTVDMLLTADQPSGSYYIASRIYHPQKGSEMGSKYNKKITTAILVYDDVQPYASAPILPDMPDFHDMLKAYSFLGRLTALVTGPFWAPVPQRIDNYMFFTVSMGIVPCPQKDRTLCQGLFNQFVASSINNVSFHLPSNISILQAYYNNVDGVYTDDFPDYPPYMFDFTNEDYQLDQRFIWTKRYTKVKRLKFNATVEIIIQSTNLVEFESHPIHLHGFNFYVVAIGFGNFDPIEDRKKFNLVNPHVRNTITIPVGGWVAIRFQANNPGVWFMHCHLEAHSAIGLATAFIVEDGPTPSTKLPPPPSDYPQC